MALYERKLRHTDSENMRIFEDKPFSENPDNVGYRKTKNLHAASRAPLQDCTTAIENTRNQPLRTTKQVHKVLELKTQFIEVFFNSLHCCS